jgi:hypothetical protein
MESYFNQEIKENVLPISLKKIRFGFYFNQEIKENVLPKSLHELILGFNFNQEIKENVLPDSLKILDLGFSFNQDIKENILPKSLHILKISREFQKNIIIPESVKEIYIWSHNNLINNLPYSVEDIYINFNYSNDIFMKKVENLPFTVKKIVIDYERFMKYLTKIPFDCQVEVRYSQK